MSLVLSQITLYTFVFYICTNSTQAYCSGVTESPDRDCLLSHFFCDPSELLRVLGVLVPKCKSNGAFNGKKVRMYRPLLPSCFLAFRKRTDASSRS